MSLEIRLQLGARHPSGVPDDKLGFGRVFTDHMFVAEYDPERGWHDARITPRAPLALDPAANVFHYGQAVFEGMKAFRWADGKVRLFQPQRHCARLADSVARMAMPAVHPEESLAAIEKLVGVEREWVPASPGTALYIRPVVIGAGTSIGVGPASRYLFYILLSPVGPYYGNGLQSVRIWVEREQVRAVPGGVGTAKTGGNYAASLLAAERARALGCDQALWINPLGKTLQEVGMMNVFVRIGDEVATPALDGSVLDGVTRHSALTLLRSWGIRASERPIPLDEVVGAHERGQLDEVFGTGTAASVQPVGELVFGDRVLKIRDGKPGPLAKRLHETIQAIQYGRQPDPEHWMALVD